MKIHRLHDTIINRIAAGEVVERPASVVKELVENAIDAGADYIEIAAIGGGKNFIRVSDNGRGIAADELELAVSRHCTSKMGEDIFDIRALGFRGEALPSIASVAHLRLASRPQGGAGGAEVNVSGGSIEAPRPAAMNCGTIAEVRDLFYATPARLKFLKSDRAEAAAISDIIKRIAIAFPHIRFTLSGADRNILDLPAAPLFAGEQIDAADRADIAAEASAAEPRDLAQIRLYQSRLNLILGEDFAANSLMLNARREGVHLFGFITIPSYHRGNALHQFAYVNGRPVRDKMLAAALRAAYADALPHGRYAAAALFLQLDSHLVDVNVHPAKADVRFRDGGLIRGLIIGAIRQTLQDAGARPATTAAQAFARAAEQNRQAAPAAYRAYHARQAADYAVSAPYGRDKGARGGFDEATAAWPENEREAQGSETAAAMDNAAKADGMAAKGGAAEAWTRPFPPSADFRLPEASAEAEAAEHFPLGAARAQIHKNYIIAQTQDSLIIVDQHAAHERLVYETLKQALYAKPAAAQMLLIPEIIDLPPEDIGRLTAQAELLAKLGLDIEAFGSGALMVRAVPAILGQIDVPALIRDLADETAEYETVSGLKDRLDYVAATMACHGSVRSGRLLAPQEMNALLRQMEAVPQSGTCNHGRPTFIELKLSDIEKLFARR